MVGCGLTMGGIARAGLTNGRDKRGIRLTIGLRLRLAASAVTPTVRRVTLAAADTVALAAPQIPLATLPTRDASPSTGSVLAWPLAALSRYSNSLRMRSSSAWCSLDRALAFASA